VLDTAQAEILRQRLVAEAWRCGDLTYKLHDDQYAVYQQIHSTDAARFVAEIARRWGKTFLFVVIAVETCLRNPGCRVPYGAPTLKDLEEFIIPTFEAIIADAPDDCRPKYNSQRAHWEFPNGSWVHLFGCDDKRKANRGRGPPARRAILDEAGFIPFARYVVKSILNPQLMMLQPHERPASMLLASTPAEEPDHDFTAMAEKAEARGNYANRTIYDNPRLTQSQIQTFIEDDAKDEGLTPEAYVETDDFRREYLAQRVVNKLLLAVPEWESARATSFVKVPRPQYFDAFSILDPGGHDPHFGIFGYWHFELAKYVVEGEFCLRDGENSAAVAQVAKAVETRLWGEKKWNGTLRGLEEEDPERRRLLEVLPDWMRSRIDETAPQQPWARWMDHNVILARDLFDFHGISYLPTSKFDTKEAGVNALRVVINSQQLLVDPSCTHLDRHLKQTTWKDHKRKDFARKNGEHGDGVDCCIYMTRNATKRNPRPKLLGERHAPNPGEGAAEVAKVLFARPRRIRSV